MVGYVPMVSQWNSVVSDKGKGAAEMLWVGGNVEEQ